MALAPSFAGVILAAGASSRMGSDKALLPWQGGTFLSTAIRALQPFTDLVLVVVGANEERLVPVIDAEGAFTVRNPSPEQGQFSSLRVGLENVLNRGRDAALLTLVDRPAPSLPIIDQIKQEFLQADGATWAVVPEYAGKHGHPIAIGREMIAAFLNAPASSNARDVEHANQQHIRYLPVSDPLVALNINTPEDFENLQL
ncbi:MAG TPA: nucleotidyltransferase family protein [Candidatus Angelobacter sp.]|nr:nucleotidyltransferase family protein [Candidatus Angelobacter sp.]